MSKILTPSNGKWHDELKAVAYYSEADLEKTVQQHAESLFPDHYVIPFKKDVASKSTAVVKRPDLALIRFDFSAWAVVEVELEGHTLNHVLEQTRVFRDGDYNLPAMAEYMRAQLEIFYKKRIPLKKLKAFLDSCIPSVLVIADGRDNDWREELRKLDIKFCVFEIYKNVSGQHVYRTFGEYPVVIAEEAHCRPHQSLPNTIEIIGNFTFKGADTSKGVDVLYEEHLTSWAFFEEKGKQYLRFVGKSNPLPLGARQTYGLLRDKSNNFYFRRS
jgi:hypothetical protein